MSSREWLLSLIKEDMRSKRPLHEDVATTVKPKSKIQELMKEFYQRLKVAESPDEFDKFYVERLENYPQMNRFSTFLVKLCDKISLKIEYPYWEKEFQKAIFLITERRLEEQDTINVVFQMINEKYQSHS